MSARSTLAGFMFQPSPLLCRGLTVANWMALTRLSLNVTFTVAKVELCRRRDGTWNVSRVTVSGVAEVLSVCSIRRYAPMTNYTHMLGLTCRYPPPNGAGNGPGPQTFQCSHTYMQQGRQVFRQGGEKLLECETKEVVPSGGENVVSHTFE